MADFELTRRKALAGIGVAAVGGAAGVLGTDALGGSGWTTADSDTTEDLHDVALTAEAPFAIGTNGRLLERGSEGWTTVLEDGPGGDGNDLYAADATDDGAELWIAGASGAVGVYDVAAGELRDGDEGAADYSAPGDRTGNFDGLAVAGDAGEATVFLSDQSGHVYRSTDGGATWSDATPGTGAAIPAVELRNEGAGHLIDTNGAVFATSDGGTWEKIGIEDADATYHDLASDGADEVTVVGGRGTVRRYDGESWGESTLGDAQLNGVTTEGTRVAVGAGGAVFAGSDWTEANTPTDENLRAVARGERAYAVGASGTVIENWVEG